MDLSTVSGLSEEQQASILALHNKETEGLKTNRDDFRTEKDALAIKTQEALQQAEDTRLALQKSEEDKLKLAGDMDGLKSHYEQVNAEQLAKIQASSDKAQGALLSRDKSEVMSDLMGGVHDNLKAAGKAMLSNALNISYNDEGKAIHTFKHNGEVVADSIESFKSWAAENSDYKQVLKGVDSGGAGVTQSSGVTTTANKSYSDMSLKERSEFNSK
jgi:hypothetical protein